MRKILVIEDDESIKNIITEILVAEGFRVISATNGQKGIELAKAQVPNLIICDIMMPNLNGYSVLKALRLERNTALTPFIFLTAKVEKSDIRQGMNLGADDYLTKPFTKDELLVTITARLKKQESINHHYTTDYQRTQHLESTIDNLEIINSKKEELLEKFFFQTKQILSKRNMALHLLQNSHSAEQYEQYFKILQEEYQQEITLINEFSEVRNLLTPENIHLLRKYNLLHE